MESHVDWDRQIGYWIKNEPYFWIAPSGVESEIDGWKRCSRVYIRIIINGTEEMSEECRKYFTSMGESDPDFKGNIVLKWTKKYLQTYHPRVEGLAVSELYLHKNVNQLRSFRKVTLSKEMIEEVISPRHLTPVGFERVHVPQLTAERKTKTVLGKEYEDRIITSWSILSALKSKNAVFSFQLLYYNVSTEELNPLYGRLTIYNDYERAQRLGVRYLIFYLILYVSEEEAHANLLILDLKEHIIYLFDPWGWQGIAEFSILKEKISYFFSHNLHISYKIVETEVVCPYGGPQDIEMAIREKREGDTGFCVFWSLYLFDAILKNPTLDFPDIMQGLLLDLQKTSNFRLIIRRYRKLVEEKIIYLKENILKEKINYHIEPGTGDLVVKVTPDQLIGLLLNVNMNLKDVQRIEYNDKLDIHVLPFTDLAELIKSLSI